VSFEGSHATSAKLYPTTAPLPLGRSELAIREGAVYLEAPTNIVEVYVLPLQTEQLAGAHPGMYGQNVESFEALPFSSLQ
jgi:hypothetical protein